MRGAEPPAACVEGPLAAGLAPEATGGDARCSTLPGGLSRSSSYLTHAPKTGVTITAKCLCKARSGAPPQGRPLEDRAHTAPRHREAPSPQPPRASLLGRGQLGARLPLLGLPRPISAPPGQEKSRRASPHWFLSVKSVLTQNPFFLKSPTPAKEPSVLSECCLSSEC